MNYDHLTPEQKREFLRVFFEEGREAADTWLWRNRYLESRALSPDEALHLMKCLDECCADPSHTTPEESKRLRECLKVIGL